MERVMDGDRFVRAEVWKLFAEGLKDDFNRIETGITDLRSELRVEKLAREREKEDVIKAKAVEAKEKNADKRSLRNMMLVAVVSPLVGFILTLYLQVVFNK